MPASSKKSLYGALIANLGIAATKLVVAALTGSTVMLAEGIHSLVDTGNSSLMLFGRSRSKHRADGDHPFGYGMELYFWSFVVAMVVFGGGGGLSIYQGILAVAHPHAPTSLWQAYAIIGVAALFEGSSLVVGLREFAVYRKEKQYRGTLLEVIRASKDPAIFLTVLEDTAALIGLGIAAAGLTLSHVLHAPVIDGIASILIGLVLVLEAALLGYESRELIIGESARPIVLHEIRRVTAQADLGQVVRLRTLQLGPDDILVVMRLRLDRARTLGDLQPRLDLLVADLRAVLPAIKDVVFDMAP